MKAVVEIIGEYQSFQRMVTGTVAGSSTLKREFTELSLSASKSAEAQVKSSALKIARMREEIAAVQSVSAAYKRGSDEQIAAMTLVARKQAELNRLTGASAFTGSRRGAGGRHEGREASGLTRGLLSGGGIEHLGLAALSGGAFFGSFVAAHAGREAIGAATESLATEKQLAAQYKASGQSLEEYRGQIDKTLDRVSALAGFNKDELTKSYTTVFRAAGDTAKALNDEAIAANLARGRHMDLQAASLLVAKVINGNVGILRRYGIETHKGETATEALAAIQQKYAGQAAAGTTAQEKFTAELHNSEVIIGTALLPAVTHLLTEGAAWLDQMNRSGKLQKDVNAAVHDGAVFFHLLADGAHLVVGAVKIADDVTGSFKHTVELLIGLKLASWATGAVASFAKVGASATVAEGEVAALQTSLLGLSGLTLAPIAITLLVDEVVNGKHGLLSRGASAASQAVAGAVGISTSSNGLGPTYQQYLDASKHKDATYTLIESYMKKSGITDPRQLRGGPLAGSRSTVSTDLSATSGLGPHHAATFDSAVTPKVSTGAVARYGLSDLQKLNLALEKNPNDRSAITAKIAYDKSAAAFAEKRISEGRGSKSLVDQLSNVYSDMNSLQSRLESLSKKSLVAETKSAKQRTEDGKKAQKALEDSAKQQQQLLDQAKQTAFGVLGPLGGGPVLTGPAAQFVQQYGGHLSGKAYLQDITQQNKAARGELTNLNTLRRRGAPQDLIANILSQGTAGQGMAQALAHATPAVLKAFLGQYRERQQTAIQLAKMQVATMHVDKIVTTGGQTRTDAHDRPSTNKFGRVPTAGRRR